MVPEQLNEKSCNMTVPGLKHTCVEQFSVFKFLNVMMSFAANLGKEEKMDATVKKKRKFLEPSY